MDADIACFGHSHQLGAEMVNETLFINPGSIRLPIGRRERTYVILDILESAYQLKVYDIDRGEITELARTVSFLQLTRIKGGKEYSSFDLSFSIIKC